MNRFPRLRAGVGALKGLAALALVTTLAACTAGGAPTAVTLRNPRHAGARSSQLPGRAWRAMFDHYVFMTETDPA